MYALPITSILGRLPVVQAGDTETIPFSYRNGCHNGAHRYNHDLAKADTGWGLLSQVLCQLLGAWLVLQAVRLIWSEQRCYILSRISTDLLILLIKKEILSCCVNEITSIVLFFFNYSQSQHFSENDRKMQLLRVHIPENVLSPSPKFS